MSIPVDTPAPLPNMLKPAVLQQGGTMSRSHFPQASLYGILSGRVEHHSAQVKRRSLECGVEHIRDIHEDDIPHEQAKEGSPNAAFGMCACRQGMNRWHKCIDERRQEGRKEGTMDR